jgi:uncharacterized protein
VKRKIYRWYKHLRRLEEELWRAHDETARVKLLERLDGLQRDVGKVAVPLSYADQLYHLRLHIDFLRQRIEAFRPAEAEAAPTQSVPEAAKTA